MAVGVMVATSVNLVALDASNGLAMKLKIVISLLALSLLLSFSKNRSKPVSKIEKEAVTITPNHEGPLRPYSMVDQHQFD